MNVILGPFHPHLEDALVEEILRHKNDAPLAPLLLLVPSDSLRRRVKVLLARERGLNFLNLHALTFFQLSLRLVEERTERGRRLATTRCSRKSSGKSSARACRAPRLSPLSKKKPAARRRSGKRSET